MIVVFLHVDLNGDADLAQVVDAGGGFAGFFDFSGHGEKQGGENCNDGDHDEQFDEGEGGVNSKL